jgi:hypothetical protein
VNAIQLRKAAPVVYGMVAAVLWIFAPSGVALVFSIVGALALGLMYVVGGTQIEAEGLGRQRNRDRKRNRRPG